jgi:hypothetical protein
MTLPNFLSLVTVPTIQQMVTSFWTLASSQATGPNGAQSGLNPQRVDNNGPINQIIMNLMSANSSLWQSLSDMGSNLTDLSKSKGAWLDLLAWGFYQQLRTAAQPTIGNIQIVVTQITSTITLTNPYTGVSYTGPGTGSTGTFTVTFTASTSGVIGNCALSALSSSAPSSYTIASGQVSGNTWITSLGLAPGTDNSLQQQCFAVIAQRANGVNAALAAQIGQGTGYQVGRVWAVPGGTPNLLNVYCAAPNGPATATQITNAQTIANLYTENHSVPACLAAIVQPIYVYGTISFVQGTPRSVINSILSGLTNWLSTLPINTGGSSTQLAIYKIDHQLNLLDTTKSINYSQLYAIVNGVAYGGNAAGYAQSTSTVIPATPGSIWSPVITAYDTTVSSGGVVTQNSVPGIGVIYQ